MPHSLTESIFFQIALILMAAKVGGEICERWLKQPAVLGEIICGVLLGESACGWLHGNNMILGPLGEIGAVLLLFEVGLESDIDKLLKVGGTALFVASVGVLLPFLFGYVVVSTFHYPHYPQEALFVGAALTATSVGITARVFKDMDVLNTREAQIVLGAAVADDVIGLIILAAVSELKAVSWISIGNLTLIACLFLIGAIVVGQRATPLLLRWARAMQIRAAVPSAALIFCLLLAALAKTVQLAPLVGAFAAGLALAKTEHKIHFEGYYTGIIAPTGGGFEEKIKSIGEIFIPVFFVMMGVRVDLHQFDSTTPTGSKTLLLGGALLTVAIIGKLISGLTAPGRALKRGIIAVGMIPRGEVGLIFASIGLTHGIINKDLYAAIIFVVIGTTVIAPTLLGFLVNRSRRKDETQATPGP